MIHLGVEGIILRNSQMMGLGSLGAQKDKHFL